MANGFDGRGGRQKDGSNSEPGYTPIQLEQMPIDTDEEGFPTFIFKTELAESEKPSSDRKILEVVLLWGEDVLAVKHVEEPATVTLGYGKHCDFRLTLGALAFERFVLLEGTGGGFVFNWPNDLPLKVKNAAGEVLRSEDLVESGRAPSVASEGTTKRQYKIGLHERVALQVGDLTFVVQYIAPAKLIPTPLFKTIDYYFTKVLTLSFLAHLFLLAAILLTPKDPTNALDDLFKNSNRFAKLLIKPVEPPKKKFELAMPKEGGKAKDEEGKFGKRNEDKKDAMASKKGAPVVDPNKKEKDRKVAFQSGLLAALKGDKSGSVSNILGPGGLGTGINNAIGGLRGAAAGDAGGAGGLGTKGTGSGGGGSLGIGGFGNGKGTGALDGKGADLTGRGKGDFQVIVGRTITKGCLSQQAVSRVINRAQSQAKYCYEKELTRNPTLAGKITTSFVIGASGDVNHIEITNSTMDSPDVEECLKRVVERLRFPPCEGGGVAEVTYPWIFKSGGNS
jgi:hypothetical protein